MTNKSTPNLPSRLRELRKTKGLSQSQMADILGITRRSYGLYELGKTKPKADKLVKIADHFTIDPGWLLLAATAPQPSMRPPPNPLKIVGLAECGLAGWYDQTSPLALTIERPRDLTEEAAFAVVAAGTSLLPEGVKPGYVCLCSPETLPEPGDLVFVKDKDSKAALKIFRSMDADWLQIEGYLPPAADGKQELYTERKSRRMIAQMATVIYIKRRQADAV